MHNAGTCWSAMIATMGVERFRNLRRVSALVPEAALALFLTAGVWKGYPVLAPLQSRLDITCACAVLACLAALPHLIQGLWTRQRLLRLALFVVPLVALAAVLALRALPELSPYGLEKALRFAILTCPAFALGLVAARDDASVRRLASCLVVVSMAVVLGGIVAPPRLAEGTAVAGYLGLGRLAGLGTITAFGVLAPAARTLLGSAALFLTCWPLLWWLATAGARGPLLASLVAALVHSVGSLRTMWHSSFSSFLRRLALWPVALLAGAVLLAPAFGYRLPIPSPWGSSTFLTTADRLDVLYREGGASYEARLMYYKNAAHAFLGHPLAGTGTGTFREGNELQGTRAYPHNLVLEVAAETGVLGLAPLAFLLSISVLSLLRRPVQSDPSSRALQLAVLALLVYTLGNAMVSGDINDNRVLFAMCGLAAGLYVRQSGAPTHSAGVRVEVQPTERLHQRTE